MRGTSTKLMLLAACLGGSAAGAEEAAERLARTMSERVAGVSAERVRPSAVPGVYEVRIGTGVVYVTEDARYVFTGKLVDWEKGRDLTEEVLAEARLERLAEVPESKMIIYEPEGETRHTITTFTDIDCPYCRKMHAEMAQLNRYGIRVRYLLYPRTGVGSVSYRKAVSVWCADDRLAEMTRAKQGQTPEPRECASPVDEHMSIAQELGLTGTPMSVTDTGERIVGYMPARELLVHMSQARREAEARAAEEE